MAHSKTIIACLLVIALLSGYLVSTAPSANAGSDYGASNWAVYALKVAGKVAAAIAIQRLTNRVLDKVRSSGPDGKAGFVLNWVNFATQGQYTGEGVFRAMLSSSHLCSYFANDIKKAFGVLPGASVNLTGLNTRTNSLQTFGLGTNCSLPSGFTIGKYQQDFAGNGGWDAWSRMLQPQNNPYGAAFQSIDEITRQRALAQSAATTKAVAGGGFLGFGEGDCKVRVGTQCLVPGNIKTPGSTVDKNVANAFDSVNKFLAASDDSAANAAITAVTTIVVNRFFDLAFASGGDTNESTYSVPSPQRTGDSYKDEFCMAEDNISPEAGFWVKTNYPQAWSQFPLEHQSCSGHTNLFGHHDDACGKSYCEQVREEFSKNEYPYTRCTESCANALKASPAVSLPGATFQPYPLLPSPTAEAGAPPPADAGTKHGNHQAEVAAAKAELVAAGKQFPEPGAVNECFRFAIVQRAVQLIGGGAGFLDKPGGNNCGGFAVDIIAFSDGYIYDVLAGTGDGSEPAWNPTGCGPADGNGTCPDRYRGP